MTYFISELAGPSRNRAIRETESMTNQDQTENAAAHCVRASLREGKWDVRPLLLLPESCPPQSQPCPHPFHDGSGLQMPSCGSCMGR